MNSINYLNALTVNFNNPWLLFLLIPAFALMLFPYFRLPKYSRRTRSRVISLVLHSIILLMAVLLLAGLSFTNTQVNVKKDVILLVDVSESMEGNEDDMNEFIQSVLSDVDPDYRIGVVTFANDCVYSSRMGADSVSADKIFNREEPPVRNATDISSALLFSRELLSSPSDGRIILLSDGRQTDGNALITVQALADEGVRVDTVYFSAKGYEHEVQISSAEAHMNGALAEILVTVESTDAQTAKINYYDNGVLLNSEPAAVALYGGENVFSYNYVLSASPFHIIKTEIEAERDTRTENNSYYTYLNLETSSKTLLVDGSGNGAEKLTGLLADDFDITAVTVEGLPSSVEELCRYNEVIFMNVANADLPEGFDAILSDYVQLYGGGLYTIGGDKAYAEGDMNGTLYEELLPVKATVNEKSLGLLLIIDSSGSMRDKASDSNATRMDLAKEAAIASIECLSPNDYVGVISFNAAATREIGMSSMDRSDTVIQRIRSIEPATGTYYERALKLARDEMLSFNSTDIRHIIFLTDGEPVDKDNSYVQYIDQLRKNGVTMSTIALGPSVSTNTAEQMAQFGGGRFYKVEKESQLKRIMIEETTTAGRYLNEFSFTPSIVNHTAAVAGISSLPKLEGFYGTTLKEGATMILGYDGNPIYAEWYCGLGRVGSFMCDLYGDWSAEFFTDENGIRFITNTVNGLMSSEISEINSDLSVSFTDGNFTAQAVITAKLKAGETVTAQVTAPDGNISRLSIEQFSGSSFATSFATVTPGIYTLQITVTGNGAEHRYTYYTAFSYSKEYRVFADDSECFKFLDSISENGNGRTLFSAENLFGKNNETFKSSFNPSLIFLIICVVLFLLDIVVRKFRIKLPKEIREERANNSH